MNTLQKFCQRGVIWIVTPMDLKKHSQQNLVEVWESEDLRSMCFIQSFRFLFLSVMFMLIVAVFWSQLSFPRVRVKVGKEEWYVWIIV